MSRRRLHRASPRRFQRARPRRLKRLSQPRQRASSIDDAVQDVFLVVHKKLADFEGRSSHRVWLFAIALRVAREHQRRDNRLQLDDSAVDRAAATMAHADDALDARRRVELLDGLLSTLDTTQREVFVMAEIEGFSAPEIAQVLGVKLNTVYSRLRLGRERFERALARKRRNNG